MAKEIASKLAALTEELTAPEVVELTDAEIAQVAGGAQLSAEQRQRLR